MRRIGTAALCASLFLAGCASTGGTMAGLPKLPGTQAQADVPRENFSYRQASDRDVRVTVGRVLLAGDSDFLPGDSNWLQIHMTVANIGTRTLQFTDVKEKLSDGTVIASANSPAELMKPPSFVKDGLFTVGVGTAGMVVGSLLFPPAAIASGAIIAFAPMFQADRMQKTLTKLNQTGLQADPIAPGTSSAGYVYVPAVRGQSGLIVFYEVDGASRSLTVPRVNP